jgi:DNA replication protein DnaC
METINFQQTLENLKDTGFNPVPNLVNIGVPDAKNNLWRGISYFCKQPVWLSEYDQIVAWLTSNDGRGLFCYGNCGLGKTLICGKVIPVLLNYYCHKIVSCYDAQQMNANLDTVKSRHIIYIDDIGTENLSVKYGEKRLAFSEIVDEAEKRGKLLIATTNLSLNEISEKYGERTMDRLVAITKRVNFIGKSLRK